MALYELLRRGLLQGAAPGLPGVLQAPQQPPQQAQGPVPGVLRRAAGAAGNAAGRLFGGPDDPNLSPEQNAAARKQAMMQAGLSMMAAGGPSYVPRNFGQIAAMGAMHGQQAGGQARQQAYLATQEERLAQALQDPVIMQKLTPQEQALIRVLPPQQAVEMLQKILATEPVSLSEGSALVDPRTGQQVTNNPKQLDPLQGMNSDVVSAAALLGLDPRALMELPDAARAQIMALAMQLRRSGATNVSVDTRSGERTQNALVDVAMGDYGRIVERADAALDMLPQLSMMEQLNDQFRGGRAATLSLPLREFVEGLGVPVSQNLSAEQVFRAISNNLTLNQTAKLKGAISNKELDFLSQTVPQLHQTQEGRALLINYMRRMAEREIEMVNLAQGYFAENPDARGWLEYKYKWARENPLFSDSEIEQGKQTARRDTPAAGAARLRGMGR
jgi:hypothetical protein